MAAGLGYAERWSWLWKLAGPGLAAALRVVVPPSAVYWA